MRKPLLLLMLSLLAIALLAPMTILAEGRAQGKVTDKDGNPIKGVEIRLVPTDRPDFPTVKVKTDKKGRYIFGLIRKATYRLAAFKEGLRVSVIDGNIATPKDESLWAYKGPISPGGTPPELSIDGLTTVTYDLVMVPNQGDPGEWGTGQPLLPVNEIIGKINDGDVDEALKEIRRSLSAEPDAASLNYLLAYALLQKKEFDGAQAAIDKCLATNPDFEGANQIRGKLLEATGKTDEALEAYKKEAETAPSEQVRKDAMIAEALILLKKKQLDKAAPVLEQVVALDPENVSALQELANCYVQMGENDKAEEVMAKVSSLGASDDPSVLYNLGAKAFNDKDFAKAADYFERTIDAKQDFAEAYLQLGYSKLNLGDIPTAMENLKKYVELEPDGPAADSARAIIQSLSGK